VRECRFEPPPIRTPLPEFTHKGVLIPGVDASEPLPARGRVSLPVYGAGRAFGRFVLDLEAGTTGVSVPPEDRALALALADQLGTVLANEMQH
jgi:hypothetical protein